MKYSLIETKNTLQVINSRVDEAKIQISDLEHKEAKKPNLNNKKKESQKHENSVRSLWDNFKHTNIRVWVCGKDREKEIGNLFEK